MKDELTRASRLSTMLIVAAVAVPVVALAGMLVLRRYVLVRYDTHVLTLWLVLDAVILAAGLIVRESETIARLPARRRNRRKPVHTRPSR